MIDKENFPSNSLFNKKERTPLKKIAKGNIIKSSAGKTFFKTFFEEDAKDIVQYLIEDVLKPSIKSVIFEMITGGLEMSLFGERRVNKNRSGPYPYNKIDKKTVPIESRGSFTTQTATISKGIDNITLESREEANNVLATMYELIAEYGQVSVADLYDLIDITAEFTDNKYGWTDLLGARVSTSRFGYVLNLPKPKPL